LGCRGGGVAASVGGQCGGVAASAAGVVVSPVKVSLAVGVAACWLAVPWQAVHTSSRAAVATVSRCGADDDGQVIVVVWLMMNGW